MNYLDFETNFDNALVEFLQAANIPAKKIRGNDLLQTPYVDVGFELGPSFGQKHPLTGEDVIFAASLTFTVLTERGDNHAKIVTKIREMMLERWKDFISSNVPFYEILDITGNGSTYQINEELDETTLSYNLVFGLVDMPE